MEQFNWVTTLQDIISGKTANPDWKFLKGKSACWTTCACGNLCDAIPRRYSGQPDDLLLATHGSYFYMYITDKRPKMALETLHVIERRAMILLKEIKILK